MSFILLVNILLSEEDCQALHKDPSETVVTKLYPKMPRFFDWWERELIEKYLTHSIFQELLLYLWSFLSTAFSVLARGKTSSQYIMSMSVSHDWFFIEPFWHPNSFFAKCFPLFVFSCKYTGWTHRLSFFATSASVSLLLLHSNRHAACSRGVQGCIL